MVYQFTSHGNLPKGSACPINKMFQLYGKLVKGEKLTKEENEYITSRLYGSGGNSASYRLLGFEAPFHTVLPKILVKQWGNWQEYYAPNKTALRKVLYGRIEEMVYVN